MELDYFKAQRFLDNVIILMVPAILGVPAHLGGRRGTSLICNYLLFGFLDFLLLLLDKVGSLALHPRVFCFHIHLAWCQRRRIVVIIHFVV